MLNNTKIAARIDEPRAKAAKAHKSTVHAGNASLIGVFGAFRHELQPRTCPAEWRRRPASAAPTEKVVEARDNM
jgi:hypothetical protein